MRRRSLVLATGVTLLLASCASTTTQVIRRINDSPLDARPALYAEAYRRGELSELEYSRHIQHFRLWMENAAIGARENGSPQNPEFVRALKSVRRIQANTPPMSMTELERQLALNQQAEEKRIAQTTERNTRVLQGLVYGLAMGAQAMSQGGALGQAVIPPVGAMGAQATERRIEEVLRNGEIVRLDDGSIWMVNSMDALRSSLWLPVAKVLVVRTQEGYLLINKNRGNEVRAAPVM